MFHARCELLLLATRGASLKHTNSSRPLLATTVARFLCSIRAHLDLVEGWKTEAAKVMILLQAETTFAAPSAPSLASVVQYAFASLFDVVGASFGCLQGHSHRFVALCHQHHCQTIQQLSAFSFSRFLFPFPFFFLFIFGVNHLFGTYNSKYSRLAADALV